MPRLRIGRKKKQKIIPDKSQVEDIVRHQLDTYVKREDLRGVLDGIEKDKRKNEILKSLGPRRRMKLLRYIQKQKGMKNANR